MKKLVTFAFAFGFLSCAFAQVEIRDYSGTGGTQTGNDISGTIFYVTTDQPGAIVQHFAVKNVSGSNQYFGIKRLRIDAPADWTDQLSWAQDPDVDFEGSCYTFSQMASNPWTSANAIGTNHFPTIYNQNIGDLAIEVNVQSNGTGWYRYYLLTDPNSAPIDSIDLHISASTLGVEKNPELSRIGLYPNPAHNILMMSTALEGGFVLKITDSMGNTIFIEELVSNNINVSCFQNGLYFLNFYREDELIETQRVVIEH